MNFVRKLFYALFYLGRPPWDTRISPPELMAFIETHPPGRALDLGCGTGTNVITLARNGWHAAGVDFIGKAIQTARQRAREAGVEADFRVGDVTQLEDVQGPFDLVLDMGCLHSLSKEGQQAYARNLERLLAPGGTFLLYAFYITSEAGGQSAPLSVGLSPEDLAVFERFLALKDRKNGVDLRSRPSAWFTYTR
jgi:SAM-dependent methyltransferase